MGESIMFRTGSNCSCFKENYLVTGPLQSCPRLNNRLKSFVLILSFLYQSSVITYLTFFGMQQPSLMLNLSTLQSQHVMASAFYFGHKLRQPCTRYWHFLEFQVSLSVCPCMNSVKNSPSSLEASGPTAKSEWNCWKQQCVY